MIGRTTEPQVLCTMTIILTAVPLRVVLTFILSAVVYLNSSPTIGNDFAMTALFCELIFGFWLFATLRSEVTGGRAPIHES